jgi:hypothetical protein
MGNVLRTPVPKFTVVHSVAVVFAILTVLVVGPAGAFRQVDGTAPCPAYRKDSNSAVADQDNWKVRIDAQMRDLQQSDPCNALPDYWFALREYEQANPEQAVACIRKALGKPNAPVTLPMPGGPAAYMTVGNFTRLMEYQTDYALSLANSGLDDAAKEVIDLSARIVEHLLNKPDIPRFDFFGVVGTWLQMMHGSAQVLDALGEAHLASKARCQAREMQEYVRCRLAPTIDVFVPLTNRIEALAERETLNPEEQSELERLGTVLQNAQIRQNMGWVLLWRRKLSLLQCP